MPDSKKISWWQPGNPKVETHPGNPEKTFITRDLARFRPPHTFLAGEEPRPGGPAARGSSERIICRQYTVKLAQNTALCRAQSSTCCAVKTTCWSRLCGFLRRFHPTFFSPPPCAAPIYPVCSVDWRLFEAPPPNAATRSAERSLPECKPAASASLRRAATRSVRRQGR